MGRNLDYKEIEYICSLMYETYQIPIHIIDGDNNVLFNLPSAKVQNPISNNRSEVGLRETIPPPNFPIFITTNLLENFFTIQIKDAKNNKYIINVGPSLQSSITEFTIQGIKQDYSLTVNSSKLFSYYQSLPVVTKKRLIHVSVHFIYLLTNEKIDQETIVEKNQSFDQPVSMENPEVTLSERRQNITFHHKLSYERRLFQAVKEGRKDNIIKFLNLPPTEGEYGILSKKSIIRNEKNLTIAGITLATRAAIEGGLDSEEAFTLSDLFIQSLEELTDVTDIQNLFQNALTTFAQKVSRVMDRCYSKTIATCHHYIFRHLYEELTLSHLANVVNMNPSYLSVLFKKEVGISLSVFIQQARIEEAKNLLTLTNYSITEIYSLLNFTDQSYFSKIFKKFTGTTPAEYRNKYSIY